LAFYQQLVGSGHVLVARVKAGLAEAFRGQWKVRQAKFLIEKALATEKKFVGEEHSAFARMLMIAGKIEEQDHCALEAAAYYREAVGVYRRTLTIGNPELAAAEQCYARFAKSWHTESVETRQDAP